MVFLTPSLISVLERTKPFLDICDLFESSLFMGRPGNACDCYQIPIIILIMETKNVAFFFPQEK